MKVSRTLTSYLVSSHTRRQTELKQNEKNKTREEIVKNKSEKIFKKNKNNTKIHKTQNVLKALKINFVVATTTKQNSQWDGNENIHTKILRDDDRRMDGRTYKYWEWMNTNNGKKQYIQCNYLVDATLHHTVGEYEKNTLTHKEKTSKENLKLGSILTLKLLT